MLRSQNPVLGWIPLPVDSGEQQYLDIFGNPSRIVEDVTIGCGSTRGRTSRWSYFILDLRTVFGTDHIQIVRDELAQLEATVGRLQACVGRGNFRGRIQTNVDNAIRKFDQATSRGNFNPDDRKLEISKRSLLQLRERFVDLDGRVVSDLADCFYDDSNPDAPSIIQGPAGDLEVSNQRGGVLQELDHILYMYETFLGILNPSLPEDFLPPPSPPAGG